MLTSDLIRPRLRITGSSLSVEWVNEHDPALQQTAQELVTLLHTHKGQPRHAWEQSLERFIGERIDYVLLRGLAKVLTDAAVFTPISSSIPPASLREQIFARGPV